MGTKIKPHLNCHNAPLRSAMKCAAMAIVLSIAVPAPASATPIASYVFDSATLNLPDPSVWSALGNIAPVPIAGLGVLIADSDKLDSLIYRHDFSANLLAGAISFNAIVQIPPVADASTAFVDGIIGWRMVLDDGVRRAELVLGRDPGTAAREIAVLGVGNSALLFPWDSNSAQSFDISRAANGDFTITAIDAGSLGVFSQTFPSGQLAASAGLGPYVQWGTTDAGGGAAFWTDVQLTANVPEPSSLALMLAALGLLGFGAVRKGRKATA